MSYLAQKRAGAAARMRWSRNATAAKQRKAVERFDAGLLALERELAEPPMFAPSGKWQPDFTLTIEAARIVDPRYLLVRLNGKEFGVMSHTTLATKIRKALREQTHKSCTH